MELVDNLRKFVLVEVDQMHMAQSMSLVVPEGYMLYSIVDAWHYKYQVLLSGLTPKKRALFTQQQQEMGVMHECVLNVVVKSIPC